MFACPAQRPTTVDDLKPVCAANLSTRTPTVTVTSGDCAPMAPLPGCNATAADNTVLVLSVDLGMQDGFDCHYSRVTGALVGQAASADSPHYCSGRAYVAATSGLTNGWCRAGGANQLALTCATSGSSDIDGGVIDASPPDAGLDSALDGAGAVDAGACARGRFDRSMPAVHRDDAHQLRPIQGWGLFPVPAWMRGFITHALVHSFMRSRTGHHANSLSRARIRQIGCDNRGP